MNEHAETPLPLSRIVSFIAQVTPPTLTVGVDEASFQVAMPQTQLPVVTPAPNVAVRVETLEELSLWQPWTKLIRYLC
jgi:hypothetical protein